jgi:transcription elongation GreA/GreB family factor
MRIGKDALVEELAHLVRGDLEAAERAQRVTSQGATHEEARPENSKDTRALEQSYLARGQAQRVEQLRSELAAVLALKPRDFPEDARIALGALVVIEEDAERRTLFIAPARGGTELLGPGAQPHGKELGPVQVVTPTSPLGRALLGKTAGDVCEIRLPQKLRELSIIRVA